MHKHKKTIRRKKSSHHSSKKGEHSSNSKQNAWKSFWDRYCQM